MSYISSKTTLEDFVNKHIIMKIDGVPRKFFVTRSDINTVYNVSDILLSNRLEVLDLATVQFCPPCSSTFVIFPELQNTEVDLGGPLHLEANTLGFPVSSFQWKFNDVNLEGETLSSLDIASVMPWNVGEYKIVANNACNEDTSSAYVVLGPVQYFSTTCGGLLDQLFYYNVSNNVFTTESTSGPEVNGYYYTADARHFFVDGIITATDYIESGDWPAECYGGGTGCVGALGFENVNIVSSTGFSGVWDESAMTFTVVADAALQCGGPTQFSHGDSSCTFLISGEGRLRVTVDGGGERFGGRTGASVTYNTYEGTDYLVDSVTHCGMSSESLGSLALTPGYLCTSSPLILGIGSNPCEFDVSCGEDVILSFDNYLSEYNPELGCTFVVEFVE